MPTFTPIRQTISPANASSTRQPLPEAQPYESPTTPQPLAIQPSTTPSL